LEKTGNIVYGYPQRWGAKVKENLKHIVILVLLLSILIVPKFAFSEYRIQDSFNYSNSALAQTAINDGHIELTPYENNIDTINRHANGWSSRWVVTSMISSISLITGVSPRDLQALPLCAIGILLFSYVIARRLTKDRTLSIFYTIIIAYDPTVNSLTNGTYIQGWGFIYYYLLIFSAAMIIENEYHRAILNSNEKHRKNLYIFLSLIVCAIAMMYYSYYSALIYGAIFLVVILGGLILRTTSNNENKGKYMLIFVVGALIALTGLFYTEKVIAFSIGEFGNFIGSFFNYLVDIIIRLFGGDPGQAEAGLSVVDGTKFYVGFLTYMLIIIPICLLLLNWARAVYKNRNLSETTWEDIFIIAMLITGGINVVMYTGLGLVDLKYIIMFYSLSALYALTKIKRIHSLEKHLNGIKNMKITKKQVVAFSLAILFLLKFAAYIGPTIENNSVRKYNELQWMESYGMIDTNTISELRVSGDIMLRQTESGSTTFNSRIFTDTYLNRMISDNASQFWRVNENLDFIIMTDSNINGEFNIGNWGTWNTSSNIEVELEKFSFIHKVYSSPDLCVWAVD